MPVLAFLAGYSYAKRFTSLAHFWLGAALALSPVAAWIAIRGEAVLANPPTCCPPSSSAGRSSPGWPGSTSSTPARTTTPTRAPKLHSVPVRLGIPGALRLAAACHVATIALLACLPLVYPPLGWIYWAGIAAVAVLLVYEHSLVRPDDLSRVNLAFFRVNAVISLGLFAVGYSGPAVGSWVILSEPVRVAPTRFDGARMLRLAPVDQQSVNQRTCSELPHHC